MGGVAGVAEEIGLADLAGPDAPSVLARLRSAAPVAWVPAIEGWLVTGHAAAVAVMRDPVTFTVDHPSFSTARVVGPSMLSLDGDAHRRHRTPFTAPFRPRAVSERFGADIRAETRELLGRIRADGSADLRPALAGPLAVRVVAGALGLAPVGTDEILDWYGHIVAAVSSLTAATPVPDDARAAVAQLRAHVLDGLRAGHPSVLHDATDRLTEDEIVSNAAVMLFGGIETTEGMILNALALALSDPAMRSADAPAVVEESLRLCPAAAVVDRYATRPVELAGARIGADELVRVSLLAANRDPEVHADPDVADLRRPAPRTQLAFAQGPHVCVAADLARLEAAVALEETFAALPGVRLDGPAPATGHVFRKPAALRVRWDA